jgi:hypothetical protein
LATKRDQAALVALRTATRFVEALAWDLMPPPDDREIDPATGRLLRKRLEDRLARTNSRGFAVESLRLELAVEELRRRITADPVLAFEVPSRPGELWFESHWYVGRDGRTYVHF